MRPVILVIASTICVYLNALPACAEDQPPTLEGSGSYALINAIGYGNDYRTGWLASAGVYFTNFLGVVGEIGGCYNRLQPVAGQPALEAGIYNFMVGPKLAARQNRTVTPFAQVLFGGIHVGNNDGGYVNDFAWQPGAGVDITVTRSVAIRLQGDFRLIQTGGTIEEFRAAAGVVVRK
jgi:opacity protein-like surface antigen